jgi:5-formyltetrahydrofolate cyclo-ligase
MRGTKQQIRQQMRLTRRGLSIADQDVAAHRLATWLASFIPYREAPAILAYVATEQEFPTAALIEQAWTAGKNVYLPRAVGRTLQFVPHRPEVALRSGRFGIPEPAAEATPLDVGTVAFVPLVAWDETGVRLGRGGGFYDRALSTTRPDCVIGLGYAFQGHAALPCDPWDVKLDYIATERGVLQCGRREDQSPVRKEDVTFDDIFLDRVDRCRPGSGSRRGPGFFTASTNRE